MREWMGKLQSLWRRGAVRDELRAELDAHLEMEIEANLERGMTQNNAANAARRSLGNRTLIEESARDAWLFLWLETLLQDLRYGIRLLGRSRGFTLTAISVIAIGIGATTAAFTLLDHVLLRPLPFPESDRLVRLYETELANGYSRIESSPPNMTDWRSMNKSFSSMGSYIGSSVNLSGQGEPLRLDGVMVDSQLFKRLARNQWSADCSQPKTIGSPRPTLSCWALGLRPLSSVTRHAPSAEQSALTIRFTRSSA